MKTALIVDSVCSVPLAIRKKYAIFMVPINYIIDDEVFVDACDEQETQALFSSGALGRKQDVSTQAPSDETFADTIIKVVKAGYSNILIQTVNRLQGDTYKNANAGVARVKQVLGDRKIQMRVMDSRTVFAGQSLMATETIRRMLKANDDTLVRRQMDAISSNIHTFILPKDPLTALERSRERNESSVGWTQALIASKVGIHPIICNANDSSRVATKIWGFKKAASWIFQHVNNRIDVGLLSPIVVLNYAGPLDDFDDLPGYSDLQAKVKAKKLMLITSTASVAAGIYGSVGSLSVAVATPEHEF